MLSKSSSEEFTDVGKVLVLLLVVVAAEVLPVDMDEREEESNSFCGVKILLACFEDPKILRADML